MWLPSKQFWSGKAQDEEPNHPLYSHNQRHGNWKKNCKFLSSLNSLFVVPFPLSPLVPPLISPSCKGCSNSLARITIELFMFTIQESLSNINVHLVIMLIGIQVKSLRHTITQHEERCNRSGGWFWDIFHTLIRLVSKTLVCVHVCGESSWWCYRCSKFFFLEYQSTLHSVFVQAHLK